MSDLLSYYNSELAYIRELGDDFARDFPKIAGRLRFTGRSTDDPHVERLIEAFAFLTARIHKKLDDGFPEMAEAVLEVVHPHYLAPVPPMTVVQFHLDTAGGSLTAGYTIPRHATLDSEPVAGETCTFRTCYDVTLWPLRLAVATLSGPPFRAPDVPAANSAHSVLKLRLEGLNRQLPLNQLGIENLRFFLSGQRQYIHELYELIFNNTISVAVARGADDRQPILLGPNCLQQVGLDPGQELLPTSTRTPRSYQLLREYFAFPEKHLFVDLRGLDGALRNWDASEVDIYLYFNRRVQDLERFVSPETFRLGCTPVVNLFPATCEPIRVNHETSEYQVIPDSRRAWAREIFSLDSVTATTSDGTVTELAPLYGVQHRDDDKPGRSFWTSRRRQGRRRDDQPDAGTDVWLSLVDLDFNPAEADGMTLMVEATCTNRDLAAALPFGGGHPQFRLGQGGPVGQIECLLHPTPARRPPLQKKMLWRLVSHLSLNYLSITSGADAAATFSEMLKVYDFVRAVDEPFPFSGILRIDSRRILSRVDAEPDLHDLGGVRGGQPGFGRGCEITVELDDERFVGSGLFLFASILERFFALYCSVNSFSRMILRTKQRKELRRWPPRTGEKILH